MVNIFRKFRFKRKFITFLAKMHFFGNPSRKIKLIGITGTNGKTTTATLLYKLAISLGFKTGLISTVEILINEEKQSRDEGPGTTPDALALNKILKKMVKANCEYVFMEVSSHALDQNRVAGLEFDGGIFTNLTQDHLDYHKELNEYFKAKKKFFEMLPASAFALSNMDDEHGNAMLENIKPKTYFYGFGENTEILDYYGKIIKSDFSGLLLDFNGVEISSKLLGRFNAYNLLSVWSAADLLHWDKQKVNKILQDIKPPKGRFEYMVTKDNVTVIVDYAHTPDALLKVLETVNEIKNNNSRTISVFGCGGDRDRNKRPLMGKIGARLSDIAIFTSDNPRSEERDKIIEDMKSDLSHEEMNKVVEIPDRRLAIGESIKLAHDGDIIVCAGKGHEDYQEIKGEKKHFDDMEEYQAITN